MQAALNREFISGEDYLTGEEVGEMKHEYVAGDVYAMAGITREHNEIAQNIAFAIRSHLRGSPCRVFISDIKVRLAAPGEDVFYYPDVMVGCDTRDTERLFLR